jgi:hypothetical protein
MMQKAKYIRYPELIDEIEKKCTEGPYKKRKSYRKLISRL